MRKGVETAARETGSVAGDALDVAEDAAEGLADAAMMVSEETEKLAKEAAKELKKFGENIAAALEGVFWGQVVRLAKSVLGDFLETVEEAADATQRIAQSTEKMQRIRRVVSDLERGKLRGKAAREELTDLALDMGMSNPAGFRTKSVGVQADAASTAGMGGSTGIAVDMNRVKAFLKGKRPIMDVSVRRYFGACGSLGMSSGASVGVEIGYWIDAPKNLDGEFIGVSLGVAHKAGIEVGVYFSLDLRFLGFNIVPTTGSEVEVGAALGTTKTFGIPS